MPVRYILVTLKPGITAEAYEKWVREYDYKVAATRENLIKYEVYRITSPIEGAENAGWTHMERIEFKSLEQAAIDATSAKWPWRRAAKPGSRGSIVWMTPRRLARTVSVAAINPSGCPSGRVPAEMPAQAMTRSTGQASSKAMSQSPMGWA